MESSLYSLSCIHTQRRIRNQVYSPATLRPWFSSRAAPELCLINSSCTVVPTHSGSMNNSSGQTETRAHKMNTNADRAALGNRPRVFVFVFASFSVSFRLFLSYMCLLELRTVPPCCMNLIFFPVVSTAASHSKPKVSPPSVFDCWWILSYSCSVPLSGC